MRAAGGVAHLRREFALFGQDNVLSAAKRVAGFFSRQRTQGFKPDHLRVAVKDRRLHDIRGDHQPVILQNFACFIDDTTLFPHRTFTIRQQRQHVERQLAAKEIIFVDRDTVQQLRALPCQCVYGFFTVSGG